MEKPQVDLVFSYGIQLGLKQRDRQTSVATIMKESATAS